MSKKIDQLLSVGAVCFTAAIFSTIQAQAQHDSPKSIAGKYIVVKNMDKTVPPGDDFYEYANGNWIKENPVSRKRNPLGYLQHPAR
jgi:putative endopeptidase